LSEKLIWRALNSNCQICVQKKVELSHRLLAAEMGFTYQLDVLDVPFCLAGFLPQASCCVPRPLGPASLTSSDPSAAAEEDIVAVAKE
jgi:hypothetical protein